MSSGDKTGKLINMIIALTTTIIAALAAAQAYDYFKGKSSNLKNDLKEVQNRLNSLDTELKQIIAKYKSLSAKKDDLTAQRELRETVYHYMQVKNDIKRLKKRANSISREIMNQLGPVIGKDKRLATIKEKIEKATKEIDELEASIDKEDREAKSVKEGVSSIISNLEYSVLEAAASNLISFDEANAVLESADKSMNELNSKIINTKLSIYESFEDGKITENEKTYLLNEMRDLSLRIHG